VTVTCDTQTGRPRPVCDTRAGTGIWTIGAESCRLRHDRGEETRPPGLMLTALPSDHGCRRWGCDASDTVSRVHGSGPGSRVIRELERRVFRFRVENDCFEVILEKERRSPPGRTVTTSEPDRLMGCPRTQCSQGFETPRYTVHARLRLFRKFSIAFFYRRLSGNSVLIREPYTCTDRGVI
jgi:hypothetical protein